MDLRAAREKSGKTQTQVANEAMVTERMYQDYEYDKSVPNAHTAQLIAKALGSTVEELFPLPERQFKEIEKEPDGNRAK